MTNHQSCISKEPTFWEAGDMIRKCGYCQRKKLGLCKKHVYLERYLH